MNHHKEKPHTCQYCQSKCVKNNREAKRFWWWQCQKCKVNFLVSIKGPISIIEFQTPRENDKFYSVHLLLKSKKTMIYAWTPDTYSYDKTIKGYNTKIVKSFDQILDFNPQNFQNKIKTILTFL